MWPLFIHRSRHLAHDMPLCPPYLLPLLPNLKGQSWEHQDPCCPPVNYAGPLKSETEKCAFESLKGWEQLDWFPHHHRKEGNGKREIAQVLINSFLWFVSALITRLILPWSITNFIKFICLPGTCPFFHPVLSILSKINDSSASAHPFGALPATPRWQGHLQGSVVGRTWEINQADDPPQPTFPHQHGEIAF